VTYLIKRFFACQAALEVTSLSTWNGIPNPSGLGDLLVLAVVDGGATFDGSPYQIDRVALGCHPGTQGCGSIVPDEYALRLTPTAAPATRVEVPMGQSRNVDRDFVPDGAPTAARNRELMMVPG
jgi:hypothetical protein